MADFDIAVIGAGAAGLSVTAVADADPRPLGPRMAGEFNAWLTAMACAAIPLTELLIGFTW